MVRRAREEFECTYNAIVDRKLLRQVLLRWSVHYYSTPGQIEVEHKDIS